MEGKEASEALAYVFRELGTTVKSATESLKNFYEALKEAGEKTLFHQETIDLIKNNPNIGAANKRRLIRMLNRARRERINRARRESTNGKLQKQKD